MNSLESIDIPVVPEHSASPLITIGVPVYNGGASICAVLDSLLGQTYRNFVIVISDNASTDDTGNICKDYAFRDSRINYVRQNKNIGAEANFRFVFRQARTDFFMWAAADDIRSPNFLEVNLSFLLEHSDYLASTSPVRFFGRNFNEITMGDASLSEGSHFERIIKHLANWHANGRFYSLLRRDVIAEWRYLDDLAFLGSDWTLITHIASKGKLNRLSDGWVDLGTNGMSNTTDIFARYRKRWIDWILPFNRLSLDTLEYMSGASPTQKLRVLWKLMRMNSQAFRGQFYAMVQRRKSVD